MSEATKAAETFRVDFNLPLGVPVRFFAVEWREHWEFDHPSVLLFPVFRYSPNGTCLESMIEDAAIDLALDAEKGKPTRADPHPSDKKEFEWRGWDIDELIAKAEAAHRGEKVKLGTGFVGTVEQWFVFREDEGGEIVFDGVPKPA